MKNSWLQLCEQSKSEAGVKCARLLRSYEFQARIAFMRDMHSLLGGLCCLFQTQHPHLVQLDQIKPALAE
eukprot:2316166-Pyramimonas_sp.AAC.1